MENGGIDTEAEVAKSNAHKKYPSDTKGHPKNFNSTSAIPIEITNAKTNTECAIPVPNTNSFNQSMCLNSCNKSLYIIYIMKKLFLQRVYKSNTIMTEKKEKLN